MTEADKKELEKKIDGLATDPIFMQDLAKIFDEIATISAYCDSISFAMTVPNQRRISNLIKDTLISTKPTNQ